MLGLLTKIFDVLELGREGREVFVLPVEDLLLSTDLHVMSCSCTGYIVTPLGVILDESVEKK